MQTKTVSTLEKPQSIRPLTPEEVAQFNRDGFIIIRNMFSLEELKPLQQALEKDPTMADSQTEIKDDTGVSFKISIWTDLGETFVGIFPRTARVIDAVELLLGEECYHWHSKMVRKQPGDGKVAWHTGFSAWYEDGCLYPKTVTCTIAIDKNNQENGCLQVLRGSHLMGRIDNVVIGETTGGDPTRIAKAFENHELVYCEMEPGDVLFFHSNTLHGSDGNTGNQPRTLIHSAFNARSNEPIFREQQQHHLYKPINKLPDSILTEGDYTAFDASSFHQKETKDNPGAGIFVRKENL